MLAPDYILRPVKGDAGDYGQIRGSGARSARYRLSRLLAYDTDKDRTVALKILAGQYSHDERFRTRFQRESHAAVPSPWLLLTNSCCRSG
jgi:hypothetical protein